MRTRRSGKLESLRQRATHGDLNAAVEYGWEFVYGEDATKALREKIVHAEKEALQGGAEAQYTMAMYLNEAGLAGMAYHWYKKAAEQGHRRAQKTLGFISRMSHEYKESAKWYRMAAEQGDGEAQLELAWCYERGLGVPLDYDEALRWAASAGKLSPGSSEYQALQDRIYPRSLRRSIKRFFGF